MQQFNRYVLRPSSTQPCIHVWELLLNFNDIRKIVHFWIALELELRRHHTRSLNTALLLHTDELVPNVPGITVRQYQICNRLIQRTRDQRCLLGVIAFPRQQIFLTVFQRLFNVRYIGAFMQSVNNQHHIILFEVHVHLSLPLDPVGFSTKLSTFILGSDAKFSFVSNIKLQWIEYVIHL